jgi:membrane protease YdiL (CAAX protease family)
MIREFIRKLPKSVEFCLVVLICCWWAIFASCKEIAKRIPTTPTPAPAHITGIGVQLGEKDNKVIIVQVLPNTPAAKAGLPSGAVIQKIDGIATEGKPLADCSALIRGESGSKVTLELANTQPHNTYIVELRRATVLGTAPPLSTTDSIMVVVGLELFALAFMFWLARIRNWPLKTWGLRPTWKRTGAGLLIFIGVTLLIQGIATIANALHPGLVHHYSVSVVAWPAVALFSVVNGVFEEVIDSGYFIQSLEKCGMWIAVLASACFRTFLHAYHGATALLIIFPLGLVFGFIYWKWRRLWPLFVAHMLFDFVAYFQVTQ